MAQPCASSKDSGETLATNYATMHFLHAETRKLITCLLRCFLDKDLIDPTNITSTTLKGNRFDDDTIKVSDKEKSLENSLSVTEINQFFEHVGIFYANFMSTIL